MGFLTFIQRKTNPKKYSEPPRKAPPYECRISPKSPVRLVHPTSSTVSRNGSTNTHHLPLPSRASLFPAHDVEPRSHSSPGLPLPRLSDNTQAKLSRPRTSLAGKPSQAGSPLPPFMPSHRPHTSLSSRRLSSFTSTGRSHIDLLDAQSGFGALDFYGRVRASGARDYGEDVADRNIGTNDNLGSPLKQTFSFNSSDAGQTVRTPRRHASLSHRSSVYKGESRDNSLSRRASTCQGEKKERNLYGHLEAAPNPPRLTRKKKSMQPSSISSFTMQSLAELDAILLPGAESNTKREAPSMPEGNGQFEESSLRLENNNSTDSFACPPPPIRRSAGSRASGHMLQSPNQSQIAPCQTEGTSNLIRSMPSNQAPSILFSAAEEGSPNKQSMATNNVRHDGQCGASDASICSIKTSLHTNDGCDDDIPGRESEETTSSHASSLRHWSTSPLTPTTSSSNSESTLRTPSRQTASNSLDLDAAVFSPAVATGPDSVHLDQLHMELAKGDKRQTPGPPMHDTAFNIDDYVLADDESLECEEQPESEDLLFTPGYGKFGTELPGLQDIFLATEPSNLLRSLGTYTKTKPSREDDRNSECPSLCVSRRNKSGQ